MRCQTRSSPGRLLHYFDDGVLVEERFEGALEKGQSTIVCVSRPSTRDLDLERIRVSVPALVIDSNFARAMFTRRAPSIELAKVVVEAEARVQKAQSEMLVAASRFRSRWRVDPRRARAGRLLDAARAEYDRVRFEEYERIVFL